MGVSVLGARDTTVTANTDVKVLLTQPLPIQPFTYENNRSFFNQNFRILNSPHRQLCFLNVISNQNQNHFLTGLRIYYIISLILLNNLHYLLMLMLPRFAPQN